MSDQTQDAPTEIEHETDTAHDRGQEVEREIGKLTEDLAANKPPEPVPTPSESAPRIWESWPVALVAIVIAVVMTIFNLTGYGLARRASEPPTPRELQQTSDLELLALIGYIEEYREDHGRLPSNVDQLEIDFGSTAVDYEMVNDTEFIVMVSRNGLSSTFDSRTETDKSPSAID